MVSKDEALDYSSLVGKAEIIIRKEPMKVFNAFVDGREMSKFWFKRSDEKLIEGEPSTWILEKKDSNFAFEVQVIKIRKPNEIVIQWDRGENEYCEVHWEIKELSQDETLLRITETGFQGSPQKIVTQALDSTKGFNQVLIAAKVWIEHGIAINVVKDQA